MIHAFCSRPAACLLAALFFTGCDESQDLSTTPSEPVPIALAQARPIEVDETPFQVPFCGFPVLVVLSGKGKTIELGGGRTILTAPGLTATLTNLDNGNQESINITGAVHQGVLESGEVVQVFTGRNALFDPIAPGLVLTIGRFSVVLDANGNVVQPLEGSGRQVDVCALLA